MATFLARPGWHPEPAGILFAGNGRQAIAAVLSALAAPGDRIGIEALTYPVVRAIAARLGLTLVPVACDRQGLCPDALEAAHRAAPLRAVYLQPVLHNPLGLCMGPERRAALAALLARTGLVAVEDAIYSFLADLADDPPLAALAPAQTVVVDSLSKRLRRASPSVSSPPRRPWSTASLSPCVQAPGRLPGWPSPRHRGIRRTPSVWPWPRRCRRSWPVPWKACGGSPRPGRANSAWSDRRLASRGAAHPE